LIYIFFIFFLANLIFKIKEIPDKIYKRKDNDLIYTSKISLKDALLSTPIIIETLDGRQLNISVDEIIR
jgi:DnaJ-class molecular chaperone